MLVTLNICFQIKYQLQTEIAIDPIFLFFIILYFIFWHFDNKYSHESMEDYDVKWFHHV
jgi:hypothetical protein